MRGTGPVGVRLRAAVVGDRGAMTVLTAFVVAVVLTAVVGVLLVGRAMVAAHVVRAAADLAAVSGAQALRDGVDGCVEAERVGLANGAHRLECRVDGQDVVVCARLRVDVGVFGGREAAAVARAGPG